MKYYIAAIIILLITTLIITFLRDNRSAYSRLAGYPVHMLDTEYGRLSYMDEGVGETFLISHGIFGGYDQGSVTLHNLLGNDHRKLAPSRFGYPGSDLPADPTPKNQAKAFLTLLDHLAVDRTYILTTSAGGAAGIQFALQYPERTKGLILLSSGVPGEKKLHSEITTLMGPPKPLLHDFPMWFSTQYFGFIFKSMFGSEVENNLYNTMLPVPPRRQGILADTSVTNLDMMINYDDYPVDKITTPILIIHAQDDPMAKYADIQKFCSRTHPQTAIFPTGGHLITGHGDAVSLAVKDFIYQTK